jgi:hypothetical protein
MPRVSKKQVPNSIFVWTKTRLRFLYIGSSTEQGKQKGEFKIRLTTYSYCSMLNISIPLFKSVGNSVSSIIVLINISLSLFWERS